IIRLKGNYDNSTTISHEDNYNSGSYNDGNEFYAIMREKDQNNIDRYLYRAWGCHEPSYEDYTRGPQFEVGDVLSMGTNPTIINYPTYNGLLKEVNPYYLNGLKVEILGMDETSPIGSDDYRAMTIKISFEHTSVNNDVIWTNHVVLPDITGDSDFDLVLEDYKNVFIDLSKVANRETQHSTIQGFVNPSTFALENSSAQVKPFACFVVQNHSIMTIGANSNVRLEDNAAIVVRNTGTLVIEDGAVIDALGNGQIIIENGGIIVMRQGSEINLIGNNSKIKLEGTLRTVDSDFKLSGGGIVELHPSHSFEIADGQGIILEGNGQNYKFLHLIEGTNVNLDGNYLNLKNGLVEYEENSSIRVENAPFVSIDNVKFKELGNSRKTSTALYCYMVEQINIENSKFERFDIGVHLAAFRNRSNIPHAIENSHFTNCRLGLLGESLFKLHIGNSTFDLIREQGISLSNVNMVDFFDNTINGFHSSSLDIINQGVELNDVIYAHFEEGIITNLNTGIKSGNSNIFIRDGASISNNGYGISSVNSESNLISVGDRGCGHIVDNSTGIYGENIVLDIDSYIHSTLDGTGILSPNRFNGNGLLFNICNDHS
ncbi:MAG: hypothetical protein ACPG5P_03865, partial [Saprospiraceae bacterium]